MDLTLASERTLKHVRVREYVRALVRDSEPGAPAPSERELVQRFGVARMTVRQALDALVAEGLLLRVPGRGTFVAPPRREVGVLTSFTEEMLRRGMLAESQTLLARREPVRPGVARALGLNEGDSVLHWRRLRRADGTPMCIEDAFLTDALLPGFLQPAMPNSLYDALGQRGLRPTWADDSIAADTVSADDAPLLDVEPGSPVLRHDRRAFAGDMVIEVSRSVYRADRFVMRVQLGEIA